MSILAQIITPVLILMALGIVQAESKTLIDFTSSEYSIQNWFEVSDTTRSVGMSMAVIEIQKTQQYQQAVFFTLLNPQPSNE
jgi:hypothetical protein